MDPSQLQPGTRLDRYELLCPLAYGGMASVWLARFGGRLGFERLVVIKMILPQFSQDPRFQQMFLDEARIASMIEHSNVARILDVGEYQDNYFLVMEWVDGDSLSKLMRASEQRKEPIPAGVALRIAADAAAGLNAAHELKERDGTHLQVVHRDVSPQNILIANNGATKLIDFGVAKARDRASENTTAGQLKGKIRYMAPEQARGADIDHRADLWAIGALLYEMFSGGLPPYDGPNEVATLHNLTSGAPPKPLPSSTPSAVVKIVERALAHAAEDRYASALDLNHALEAAMVELNQPTTPASVARHAADLLAERKAARKRAVDKALEAARKRDVPSPPKSAPVSKPDDAEDVVSGETLALPITSPTPLVAPTAPIAPSGAYSAASSAPSGPSAPSASAYRLAFGTNDPHGQRGLGEHPSIASNGTIGSAAIAYPKQTPPLVGSDRRRRYLIAAAIGVSLAIGPIAAVGFVSIALRRDDGKARAAAESAAATTPAATTVVEFSPAVPSATETTPEPSEEPSATNAAEAAATAATPTAAASTPTTAAPTTPPPSTPPKPTATAAATHRPVAAPPPPKPRANSAPRPDRGF